MQKKLPQSGFERTEYVNTDWTATPEPGTPYADILKPEYWSHLTVGQKAPKYGDTIRVLPPDRSYLAVLFVLDVGPQWAKVVELQKREFGKPAETAGPAYDHPDYTIAFAGAAKWRVTRKADKETMVDRLSSRHDAEAWVKSLVEKLAA